MGKKINNVILKNRMIYKPIFDTVPSEKEDNTEEFYYDEIIIYDGGGVSDGNSKDN